MIEFSIFCLLVLQDKALLGHALGLHGIAKVDETYEGKGLNQAHEVKELPEPLKSRTSIKISGDIWKYKGETFTVDLQGAEDGKESESYLHISVRYALDKLVLNSFINGEWGQEEVHHGLPAGDGRYKHFQALGYNLIITTWDDYFHIYLNGNEYTFKYRMPKEDLDKIKFVAINGEFDVTSFDLVTDVAETPRHETNVLPG